MTVDYLQMTDIHKSFGSVAANSGVNFSVRRGEIHAILGENGSGKSTLMSMLSGIYTPDSGAILLDGRPLNITSPDDAIAAGIGMVHQHFKLVDVFTATENVVLGHRDSFMVKRRAAAERITSICRKYGLKVDPNKKVYAMSVSEKQTVEIVKVLYRGASLLILDEPTAVLTPQEISSLFDILRNMKQEGCAVIIITHKMNEVMEISDRVTVLRKGESVATVNTSEAKVSDLIEMMVGRQMELDLKRQPVSPDRRRLLLKVEKLTVHSREGAARVADMSFEVFGGEILGIAGISGSGQKELCESIAGLNRASAGHIYLEGHDIVKLSPREIVRRGVRMSFVPEDRLGMGLVGGMSISDNILLKSYRNDGGFILNRRPSKEISQEIVREYDIQTPSIAHQVKKLSGGNIQKVLLGRELNLAPLVLITAYPVRGLDIGASYLIYDILNRQKEAGVGVVFIGEDLDVLLALSDRIMVISQGVNMGVYPAEEVTKDMVGMMMMGKTLEADDAQYS